MSSSYVHHDSVRATPKVGVKVGVKIFAHPNPHSKCQDACCSPQLSATVISAFGTSRKSQQFCCEDPFRSSSSKCKGHGTCFSPRRESIEQTMQLCASFVWNACLTLWRTRSEMWLSLGPASPKPTHGLRFRDGIGQHARCQRPAHASRLNRSRTMAASPDPSTGT